VPYLLPVSLFAFDYYQSHFFHSSHIAVPFTPIFFCWSHVAVCFQILEVLACQQESLHWITIVISYNIYLEICKGKLHPKWKFKPVNFWHWQDVLLQQMMRYQPNHHAYAGDKGATSAIKQNAEKCIIPQEHSLPWSPLGGCGRLSPRPSR
jgi:hypothetical protein